jgi:Zn-dependent metalloprotease
MSGFRLLPFVAVVSALAAPSGAQSQTDKPKQPRDSAAIQRLLADTRGAARVSHHAATGAARFVRVAPGIPGGLLSGAARAANANDRLARSEEFLGRYGSIFGITDQKAELRLRRTESDAYGGTHLNYGQVYRGVPVFAGELRTHFNAAGELRAVNGTFVPDIALNPAPSRTKAEATGVALDKVRAGTGVQSVSARDTTLYVFREGLAKGVAGPNRLVWEVEVGNGAGVREFVYVDAHTGKFVDQITGAPDALFRKAYNTEPNFPDTPFWVEGDPFPTPDEEANNVIDFSSDAYGFYSAAFSRDSFDGAGGIMHGVFNLGGPGAGCPNASWNGVYTRFCPGVSSDDVVVHEWTHAYTQYTHNLIYQWQPGALNEAYSDIYGETEDRINGKGTDNPGGPRTDGLCTEFTAFPPAVVVNAPPNIAGKYAAGPAQFGPPLDAIGVTQDVVLVDDGVGGGTPPNPSNTDGCETPFVNAADVAGKIALIDRGSCTFVVKVKNAQLNGAIAVIVANHVVGGDGVLTMGGTDPTITIPSVLIGYSDGNLIKSELANTVNATLRVDVPEETDNTYRWLMGEDSTAFGGPIRDMWNPGCYQDPGRVSDTNYTCAPDDAGGVHTNSGVPNHAYALLVDGGSYNGQTVAALGLIKTAHIYFRAMSVYQHQTSDFPDHADSIEQSCSDLIGVDLPDLITGDPSGEILTSADCDQVATAALAVELRTPPTQCNFQPLLAKNPPDRCPKATTYEPRQVNIFFDDFESDPSGTWTTTHTGSTPDFTPRDWVWTSQIPTGRTGSAFFAIDPRIGTCQPGGDESGVLHLTSSTITIPSGVTTPLLTFDHWMASEFGYDGGNLKISVNGGPLQLVAPADYTYNAYNTTLTVPSSDPMAGEAAFSGSDGGVVNGSWGRSHVNLAPYASPGDTVQFQFDFGTDGCGGLFGWYMDDFTLYSCEAGSKALPRRDQPR